MAKAKKTKEKKVVVKEQDKDKSRAELLGGVVEGINKRYKGVQTLADPRNDERLIVPRVSTSSYGMDVALNGGFPMGRVTLAYGDARGGKTTLFLRGLANAQRRCGNCNREAEYGPGVIDLPDLKTGKVKSVRTQVIKSCECGNPRDVLCLWVDSEGVWLTEWSDKIGVWSEKVILMRPSYGEQGYDVMTSFAESGAIDIIVLDSLANMTPADEFSGGMEEQTQALAARVNNKFLRKIVGMMNLGFQRNKPFTLWAVNQYREKVGVTFGSNKVLPGGKGQLFTSSAEIEMTPGTVTLDDGNEPIIGVFKWRITKNKLGPGGGKGEFIQWMMDTDVFKVGDLQEHEYVIDKAVVMGEIEHPSSQIYVIDGQSFRGESKVVRYLAENPSRYEQLKADMLRRRLRLEDPVINEEHFGDGEAE